MDLDRKSWKMDNMESMAKDSPAPVDPMEYRDLLIFEESLRNQYLYLQRRRRKYLVFLCALLLWLAYFFYGAIISPSPYYYIHLFHRMSLLGGLFTLILYYISSLLHKTLIYPKKYLSHTNKSLRQFNIKLVPNPVSHPFRHLPLLRWIFRPKPVLGEGGVKIVLNQRGGVEGEFIEGWEMFREDFWEDEARRLKEEEKSRKREGSVASSKGSRGRAGSAKPEEQGDAKASRKGNTVAGEVGAGRKKKKVGSTTGSASGSVSSSTGSLRERTVKKKKKKTTAEQAVAGL